MASDTPWSQFSQSDYSPAQWAKACLIDTGDGASDSKDRYKLPVLEPSGALNRNAVHAAAGRIGQVQGVSSDKKATAARKLVSLYREIGEDPPTGLTNMAGDDGDRSASPAVERLYTNSWYKNGTPVELRRGPNGQPSRTIGGVAAVFDRYSRNLGGFTERVNPACFNKSRADGWPNVMCRFDHQNNYLLGTTRAGTLRLSVDNVGLNYDVDTPESRSDVLEWVTRGDVMNSSFAFQTFEDDWDLTEQNFPVRTLVSARLIDVAPVVEPAYPDATVGLRSLAAKMHAPIEDIVKLRECDELRKLFVRTDGMPQAKKRTTYGPAAAMAIRAKRPYDPIGSV